MNTVSNIKNLEWTIEDDCRCLKGNQSEGTSQTKRKHVDFSDHFDESENLQDERHKSLKNLPHDLAFYTLHPEKQLAKEWGLSFCREEIKEADQKISEAKDVKDTKAYKEDEATLDQKIDKHIQEILKNYKYNNTSKNRYWCWQESEILLNLIKKFSKINSVEYKTDWEEIAKFFNNNKIQTSKARCESHFRKYWFQYSIKQLIAYEAPIEISREKSYVIKNINSAYQNTLDRLQL